MSTQLEIGSESYKHFLASGREVKLNLLGMDVFRKFSCIIDLGQDILIFRNFGRTKIPVPQPYVNCKVVGKAARVYLDTGADGFLFASMPEAQRLGIPLIDVTAEDQALAFGERSVRIKVDYVAKDVSCRIFGKDFTGGLYVVPVDMECELIAGIEILEGMRIMFPNEGGVVLSPSSSKGRRGQK